VTVFWGRAFVGAALLYPLAVWQLVGLALHHLHTTLTPKENTTV
jgi:hypothetical protein